MATAVADAECGWCPRREQLQTACDAANFEAPFPPFAWAPVQVTEHDGYNADEKYFVGTYVDSLSVDIQFPGIERNPLQLEKRLKASGPPPSWVLVGNGLVMCSGLAVGFCPKEPDDSGRLRNLRIARLPRGARPPCTLQFPGLIREARSSNDGRVVCSSHLLTLVVTTDGWILGLACHASAPRIDNSSAGLEALNCSRHGATGAIDLSAIRFSTGGGLSLIDQVCLSEFEVAGTRLIVVQGHLSGRHFKADRHKPLALLPRSCQPPRSLNFLSSGGRAGGFHLLEARPTTSSGLGNGAELFWRDSIWIRDEIHLSGVMYEADPRALQHSLSDMCWSTNSAKIFLKEFQKLLTHRFGSVECAWHQVFDSEGSGSINFSEFGLGCKSSGYVGNVMKLWAALDIDRSGDISLEELTQEVDLDTIDIRASSPVHRE